MTTYSRLMEQRKEGYEAGLQQGRTEGIAQGRSEGSQQKAIETAKCAFAMNLSIEQIISLTGLPRETVDKLAKDNP